MHFNPYGGAAAQLAADLVNAGPDASTADVRAATSGMARMAPTDTEAAAIVAWASRLRRVFEAPDQDVRVELVNALLAGSACRPHISRHDGKSPHLHYAEPDSGPVARVRAYTAGGLAHLVCEDPDRFGVCNREGCDVVYVDTSRNGRRRFCSTRCATRVHVAEHRARRTA